MLCCMILCAISNQLAPLCPTQCTSGCQPLPRIGQPPVKKWSMWISRECYSYQTHRKLIFDHMFFCFVQGLNSICLFQLKKVCLHQFATGITLFWMDLRLQVIFWGLWIRPLGPPNPSIAIRHASLLQPPLRKHIPKGIVGKGCPERLVFFFGGGGARHCNNFRPLQTIKKKAGFSDTLW